MRIYTRKPYRPVIHGAEYRNWRAGQELVTVESAKDAAKVFALRFARKRYGRRGGCHHVRLDHCNPQLPPPGKTLPPPHPRQLTRSQSPPALPGPKK